jgi:hypothetical protein
LGAVEEVVESIDVVASDTDLSAADDGLVIDLAGDDDMPPAEEVPEEAGDGGETPGKDILCPPTPEQEPDTGFDPGPVLAADVVDVDDTAVPVADVADTPVPVVDAADVADPAVLAAAVADPAVLAAAAAAPVNVVDNAVARAATVHRRDLYPLSESAGALGADVAEAVTPVPAVAFSAVADALVEVAEAAVRPIAFAHSAVRRHAHGLSAIMKAPAAGRRSTCRMCELPIGPGVLRFAYWFSAARPNAYLHFSCLSRVPLPKEDVIRDLRCMPAPAGELADAVHAALAALESEV